MREPTTRLPPLRTGDESLENSQMRKNSCSRCFSILYRKILSLCGCDLHTKLQSKPVKTNFLKIFWLWKNFLWKVMKKDFLPVLEKFCKTEEFFFHEWKSHVLFVVIQKQGRKNTKKKGGILSHTCFVLFFNGSSTFLLLANKSRIFWF